MSDIKEELILLRLQDRLKEAERLIADAVQIMTPEQVGQWRGVRTWQELGGYDE